MTRTPGALTSSPIGKLEVVEPPHSRPLAPHESSRRDVDWGSPVVAASMAPTDLLDHRNEMVSLDEPDICSTQEPSSEPSLKSMALGDLARVSLELPDMAHSSHYRRKLKPLKLGCDDDPQPSSKTGLKAWSHAEGGHFFTTRIEGSEDDSDDDAELVISAEKTVKDESLECFDIEDDAEDEEAYSDLFSALL